MDLVATAKIVGTFGVDGALKVLSHSGEYDHFFNLKKIYVAFSKQKLTNNKYTDAWFAVLDIKIVGSFVLVKLKGIEKLEDAKYFVGSQVLVEKQDASFIKEGEFYAFDLCKCSLFFEGAKVGVILDVVEAGGGVLLEVQKNNGLLSYVPFNNVFLGTVDIKEHVIVLKNEWILE